MAFLYTKDKQDEKEIKKTMPFTIVTNNIKYFGVTLTKEVKDLYDKNLKFSILCLGSLRDHSSLRRVQTAETTTASGKGQKHTASGTDPGWGSRYPGTFTARGELSAREGSDCLSR